MSETLRTFIAVELPEEALSFAVNIQDALKSYGFNIRWVKPENIHVTLKFLGGIHRDVKGKVEDAMVNAAKECKPMQFSVKGMGVFPGVKRPKVVWCGLNGDVSSLIDLQSELDETLADMGFSKERRPFKSHLTLGRTKGLVSPNKIIDAMKELSSYESTPFHVQTITLFRSDLQPTGAVYTRLKSVSF
jgi:2'-5' RNA ligase